MLRQGPRWAYEDKKTRHNTNNNKPFRGHGVPHVLGMFRTAGAAAATPRGREVAPLPLALLSYLALPSASASPFKMCIHIYIYI